MVAGLAISFFVLIFWGNSIPKNTGTKPVLQKLKNITAEAISTSTEDVSSHVEEAAPVRAYENKDIPENFSMLSDLEAPKSENQGVDHTGPVSGAKTIANGITEAVVAAAPVALDKPKTNAGLAAVNIEAMEKSNDPVLKKMAQYEKCCGSIFAQVLIFTATPKDAGQAVELAKELSVRLKEMEQAGVSPIVTAEPMDIDGKPLSYRRLAKGEYDDVLRNFFSKLKAEGVTEAQIGMWIPLPESNLNEWGGENVGPEVFGPAYNHYSAILREYYGGVRISLLLDNETYNPKTDENELISLLPWTAVVDKKYVDSFGLQGYPWVAPANEGDEKDFDAASFLNANRAIEAARSLGANNIWFSTGTISKMFSGSPDTIVNIDASQRALMLDGILGQAKTAATSGFKVMVCIFAEDRRNTEEETDFSYWGEDGDLSGADAQAFKNFAVKATADGIPLAIYDSMPDDDQ